MPTIVSWKNAWTKNLLQEWKLTGNFSTYRLLHKNMFYLIKLRTEIC